MNGHRPTPPPIATPDPATTPAAPLPGPAPSRFGIVALLVGLSCLVSLLTRCALLLRPEVAGTWRDMLGALLIGIGYDLVAALTAFAPLLLWLALVPNRMAAWRTHRAMLLAGSVSIVFALLLIATAEWLFWDEFGSRFNFIAVDYLLYTHEVIGNIWESYPVAKVLGGFAAVSLLLTWLMRKFIWRSAGAPLRWRARLAAATAAVAVPVLFFYTVSSADKDRFGTDSLNELAGNGPYEFVTALYRNELDYMRFYATLPEREAFELVRNKLSMSTDGWRSPDLEERTTRITAPGPERRLNVILISVESLGAEFVGGAWGDSRGLTPRLDALAAQSMIFTNVYATGNRTVRGLEALALSLPPTPGQSIVKRPKNSRMFTLGDVFENKDYDVVYMYGGYSYFDNMAQFFSHSDYRVVDRRAIAKENIHYENIWGVADEDLFDLAVRTMDSAAAEPTKRRPVFIHVMTTSNHRPYTYPDERIDIPPGTGRDGAVKYTDWALGHFIDEARKRPWFRDTLFVITADHGANARGTSQIPVDKYRIPVLFYSPDNLAAGRIDRLMSQIDIGPTLLGRLNFSYPSKFLGQDIFRVPPGEERAFVANYQALGYLRDGRMVTLEPGRKVRIALSREAGERRAADTLTDDRLRREAISWYETASLAFSRQRYLDLDEDEGVKHPSRTTTGEPLNLRSDAPHRHAAKP